MKRTMRSAALCALLILYAILLPCCGDGVRLSAACTGCSAGKAGEETYTYHEKDSLILPAEFVAAYALHTAGAGAEECKRALFEDDARYMKQVLTDRGLDVGTLVGQMNERAKSEGLPLVFGSVRGARDREEELYKSFGQTPPEFEESRGTLSALKRACEVFSLDEALTDALKGGTVSFADGSRMNRQAPPVTPDSQYYLAGVKWYLSGYGVRDGRPAFVAIGGFEEQGETAFAAVSEFSGDDSPIYFAACDFGNLCGWTLGIDYGLSYSSARDPADGGMTVGASFFGGAILVIAIVVGALFVIAAAFGIFGVIKRNREGRRKYAGKKEDE